MEKQKNITIMDLARIAGVSKSTVSRVLSGEGYSSPESQQVVQAAIEKTGYRVNSAARNLRRGRTDFIGVIVPDISNSFFAEIIAAIQLRAKAHRLHVLIFNTEDSPEEEFEALDIASELNMSGLVLITSIHKSTTCKLNKTVQVPTVLVDREHNNKELFLHCASVFTDNYGGGEMAAQKIHEATEPDANIMIIRDERTLSNIEDRIAGFCDFFCDSARKILIEGVNPKKFNSEFIIEKYKDKNISCIFCLNDIITHETISAFRKHGFSIPKDVRILGFDGSAWGNKIEPSLSAIAQDTKKMGEIAVEQLLILMDETTSNSVRKIKPYYIQGGTLA